MSVEGLILSLILVLLTALWIIMPLTQRRRRTMEAFRSRQRARALTYYERILTNLHDLEEDHNTGKIATDEYKTEREYWMARGVRVLKLLEELDAEHNILEDSEADDSAIDAAIEAAINRMKESVAPG